VVLVVAAAFVGSAVGASDGWAMVVGAFVVAAVALASLFAWLGTR
jgi:hypothetical protein